MLREVLNTARITPGEGNRLTAAWPETPAGTQDDLSVFAEKASQEWDWNDFPYLLLKKWTDRSPQEAAAWLAGRHEEPAAHFAAETLARQWGPQAPAAVAAWVAGLPEGGLRDYAALGLAGSLASEQPAEAMRTALSIQDAYQRKDMLRRLAWHGTDDAAAAERRLSDAGVSPAERAEVLKTGPTSALP